MSTQEPYPSIRHRSLTRPQTCPACGSSRVLMHEYTPSFFDQEYDADGWPTYFMDPDRAPSNLNEYCAWACESCGLRIGLPLIVCPKCSGTRILGLSVGYPSTETVAAVERGERGELMFGNCCLPRMADCGCPSCNARFRLPWKEKSGKRRYSL